ncbi:hypothetical protein GCM10017624_30280 [Azotobacter vinelandii]|nr:hypothetical protein GCM10017624_30280 [Azotobacter vinelandii]
MYGQPPEQTSRVPAWRTSRLALRPTWHHGCIPNAAKANIHWPSLGSIRSASKERTRSAVTLLDLSRRTEISTMCSATITQVKMYIILPLGANTWRTRTATAQQ